MTVLVRLSYLFVFSIVALSCSDSEDATEEPIIIINQPPESCDGNSDCQSGHECVGADEGRTCLPIPDPDPDSGPECVEECFTSEGGRCIDVVTDANATQLNPSPPYCSYHCLPRELHREEVLCPNNFKCMETGLDQAVCVKVIVPEPEPPVYGPLTYLHPQRNSTVDFDRGEVRLQWEGGVPPYEIRLGTSANTLQTMTTVQTTETTMFFGNAIQPNTLYHWQIIASPNGFNREEGQVSTFRTSGEKYPPCPGKPFIIHQGISYRTVDINGTCWQKTFASGPTSKMANATTRVL